MSPTESSIRTVFRACVVNAVRRGEALMLQLIKVTQAALSEEESSTRQIPRRNLLSDAHRLLGEHEAALAKAYPMALLEIFAEGPAHAKARPADATGMDFGELSLMDDSEMQAQVEFSRAQQLAVHATDATLAELNALVSSAQGLRSVQPERNPLRPECYIRALQRVVGETGVSAEVRQLWMQSMNGPLGELLSEEYRSAAQALRNEGCSPWATPCSACRAPRATACKGAATPPACRAEDTPRATAAWRATTPRATAAAEWPPTGVASTRPRRPRRRCSPWASCARCSRPSPWTRAPG
ncbi:DUF1631 family protein [Paenacidovorax monticola]|uniref:DUF1631 family protein n=1 Tax=Paenacidovorax monticola TaxID=1926868 RepID=UPI001FE7534A|nr:DUF1631 family protein [Paenacidovorax monticola]